MNPVFFLVLLGMSLGLLFLPKKWQSYYYQLLQIALVIVSGTWAVGAWTSGETQVYIVPFEWWGGVPTFHADALSAFFLLLIHLNFLIGSFYTRGYLRAYLESKTKTELGWHYFSLFWLHSSLVMVVLLRQALDFLVAWELMSISSFFLVLFYWDKKETLQIALRYLLQMHIGMLFILSGFLYAYSQTGGLAGFDSVQVFYQQQAAMPVFILLWVGFAFKAGFIPLHTWLPQAHPAAPSHVSAMMSGVMIKVGVYGILRISLPIQEGAYSVGIFLLVMGLATALYGIMNAIMQKDMKKILAFSSIENIGIIGTGLGISMLGRAWKIPEMESLGLAGAMLHLLNHSLFKSLLFYVAGAIYQQTHTRNIEQMGGIIKKMPRTAILALIGVLAICGLPPFNGFISEFFIFTAIFQALPLADTPSDLILLGALVGLALVGGLAIFNFARFYSIIFLGTARSEAVQHSQELPKIMLLPQLLIVLLMLAIGLGSVWMLPLLEQQVLLMLGHKTDFSGVADGLAGIGLASAALLGLVLLIYLLRRQQQKRVEVSYNEPWGCGYQYKAEDVPLHQYTGASFSDNYHQLARPFIGEKKKAVLFDESEIFPQPRHFSTEPYDKIEKNIINKPSEKIAENIERAAIFQTGQLQHYVLYALAFLVFILVISLLGWI